MKNVSILTVVLVVSFGMLAGCVSPGNTAPTATAQNQTGTAGGGQAAKPEGTLTPTSETVEVIDGRKSDFNVSSEEKIAASEQELINKEFKRAEGEILKISKFECDDGTPEGVEIIGVGEGSFTKPNSRQKAYLYERCRAGRSFGIGGLIVVEGQKAAAHYTYGENGLSSGLRSLPDINKNGLSEIVISSGGMGQGYSTRSIDIWEIQNEKLEFLGRTETFSSNDGAVEDEAKSETTAYKISAQPSNDPVFFRETYEMNGKAKDWSLTKRSEKFSLDKGEGSKFFKVS